MSLSIHVFIRDDAGDIKWMEWMEYPRSAMFGTETDRQKLWGSYVIEGLGLQIIPSLSYMNVMVEREEVGQLAHEVMRLQSEADEVSQKLDIEAHELRFYLDNLEYAIQKAKDFAESYPGAGVYIA